VDQTFTNLIENLGPAGLGVTVILIMWTAILKPFMEKMQAAHEKREAESAVIIARAQGIIEGAIAKNTEMLTRVEQRLRDDHSCKSNDHDDDGN